MLEKCDEYEVPTEHAAALDERDYGDYTGKNKWDVERLLGEGDFKKLRRGWDYPVPNGETLKMVYERVVSYFLEHILPRVKEDKNVLVVAHGNSLRALVTYIENISAEGVADLVVPFRTIMIYELDTDGHSLNKEVRESAAPLAGITPTMKASAS